MAKTIEAGAVQNEQTLNNQEQFFLKYRKQILIAVAAILLIVAGCLAYKTLVAEPRENKASTAMAKAQEMFAERDFQKALNGDKTNEGFLSVIENYAGLCYAQMGKWQEAVKYLEDFSPKSDAIISPAIVAALGNAYANTGKVDEAISTLKEAASMADSRSESVNNTTSPTYLLQAARLLESQKKTDEALKIYKQIKEKYVNSAVAQDIDKYIERASK